MNPQEQIILLNQNDELHKKLVKQAAVIDRLRSVIVSMASETTSHYDRLELARKGLAIPTDSD